jgi:phage/plasmid-associated DNA primase
MDDGVFRRMLLLVFDIEILDDEKVRGLAKRFQDEKAGILSLSLEHLQNLIKNGKFTKSAKLLENIEQFKDQTNPIRRYVKDCLEKDEEVIIPKELLYNHYKAFMTEKGNMPLSSAKFFTRLYQEMKNIKDLGQQRTPKVPILKVDRARFIQGIYCNSNDIFSFKLEKSTEEIETRFINYDFKTKEIVVKVDNGDKK